MRWDFFVGDIDKMKRGTDNGEFEIGPDVVMLARYSRKLGTSKWCCPANEPGILEFC